MSLMNAERQREDFARGPGPATVRIPDAQDSAFTAAYRGLRGDFPAVPHELIKEQLRAALERTRGAKVGRVPRGARRARSPISAPARLVAPSRLSGLMPNF